MLEDGGYRCPSVEIQRALNPLWRLFSFLIFLALTRVIGHDRRATERVLPRARARHPTKSPTSISPEARGISTRDAARGR